MKEDILKIIEHYGEQHQLRKIHEEYFELDEAIINMWNENDLYLEQVEKAHKKHIAEELADVMMMLKQFQYLYGISDEHIERNIKYKVERTLKRMEEEK